MSSSKWTFPAAVLTLGVLAMTAAPLPAQGSNATPGGQTAGGQTAGAGQEATVVTVGDNSRGMRDSTLWGFAMRYMPPETQRKSSKELTAAEKREIHTRMLALHAYHNALASERNQGRAISDRDLIYTGEKLYLPPQAVIDRLAKLVVPGRGGPPSGARYEQIMKTVLTDVRENQGLIGKSKAAENLTTAVLSAAADEGETDRRSKQVISPPEPTVGEANAMMANMTPNPDLGDESPPAEPVVLGPDEQPLADGDSASAGRSTTGAGGSNLPMDLTERTAVLEMILRSAERALAENPNHPNKAQIRTTISKIKGELTRRKVEEEKQKEAEASAAAAGTTSAPAATQTAAATAPPTGGDSATPEEDAVEDAAQLEIVPDWYMRALQEWNLTQYWQNRTKNEKTATGRRKIYDPYTGQERTADDSDPYSEFSDELANYNQNQGQVQKRPGR